MRREVVTKRRPVIETLVEMEKRERSGGRGRSNRRMKKNIDRRGKFGLLIVLISTRNR